VREGRWSRVGWLEVGGGGGGGGGKGEGKRGFKDVKVEVPKENAKWCGGRRGGAPLAILEVSNGGFQ